MEKEFIILLAKYIGSAEGATPGAVSELTRDLTGDLATLRGKIGIQSKDGKGGFKA